MIVSHSSEMFGYGYIHVSDSELSDENGIQKNVIVKISTKDVSKKCDTNRIVFYSVYSLASEEVVSSCTVSSWIVSLLF